MNDPRNSDSLFSGQNHYDPQMVHFSAGNCEALLEACTRHLSQLKTTHYASARLQRLADICAGVHVMPIEHWQTKPTAAPGEPVEVDPKSLPSASVLSSCLHFIAENGFPFAMGWLAGQVFTVAIRILVEWL